MDETKNTIALVLRRQPHREQDSLVTVYTKDFGKLRLVARGTQKLQSKLAGHLEPLNLVELLIVRGRGHDYIGAAVNRRAYLKIKADLKKIYYAGQALSSLERLLGENQTEEGLFFLLRDYLELLDDYEDNALSEEAGKFLLLFFYLKLLTISGYRPEMSACLVCGTKISSGRNYFNLLNGRVLGQECYSSDQSFLLPISDNSVKIIRFLLDNSWEQARHLKFSKKNLLESESLIKSFLSNCQNL